MTKFQQSFVMVPCHSMEDFPTHYRGGDATNLLAAWTAVWHPALIASTEKMPAWKSSDDSEFEMDGCLIVVPAVAQHILDDSHDNALQTKATQSGATIIHQPQSRSQIVAAVLQSNPESNSLNEKIDPELVPHFYALGYGYLQVQIMTRQLRYSSNLDISQFGEQVIVAARAASVGDQENANAALVACFDLLQEEKNAYYPVKPDLVDLVLTAPTTLRSSLDRQLASSNIFNLLIAGADAMTLSEKNPAAAEKILERVADETIGIVGGLENELPDALVTSEAIVRQLSQGQSTIRHLFNINPTVFARRSFGLTPTLPGLLEQFNFTGAIHATFDGGKFPRGSSSNIRWTGSDDQSILAYGELPLDATDSATFLGLGLKIGEAIDSAHVATLMFAHWPDQSCDSFHDLKIICEYGSLLGEFVRLDDYFETVYDPGYGDQFTAEEYQHDHLKQAVANGTPNPISRLTSFWKNHYRLSSCRALLAQLVIAQSFHKNAGFSEADYQPLADKLTEFEDLNDRSLLNTTEKNLPVESDQRQSMPIQELEDSIVAKMVGDCETNKDQRVVINTLSSTRRAKIPSDATKVNAKNAGPIVIADSGANQTDCVIELSGTETLKFSPLPENANDALRGDPPVLSDTTLRNEFFEINISQQAGGIHSLQSWNGKTNLVTQRLSLRIPDLKSPKRRLVPARYAEMVADSVVGTSTSRVSGAITSAGRLMDGETVVAHFQQTVTVSRGIPLADISIEIHPETKLTSSVNHYFCNRLAWKDESAQISANSQESRQSITSDWFDATNFVEIQQSTANLTLLTGGLPFHRRVSRRMLDSVFIVGSETATHFKLALGVDIRYPMQASSQWLTPLVSFECGQQQSKTIPTGWLFHLNCKNIIVTWWQPVYIDGEFAGMQIRMRETEGRSGKLKLRCPRPLSSVERVNFRQEFIRSNEIDATQPDQVLIDFVGNDFFQVTLNWKT